MIGFIYISDSNKFNIDSNYYCMIRLTKRRERNFQFFGTEVIRSRKAIPVSLSANLAENSIMCLREIVGNYFFLVERNLVTRFYDDH